MIFPSAWCLSLEDKAPPEAVTAVNPAFPDGAVLFPRARVSSKGRPRRWPGWPRGAAPRDTGRVPTLLAAEGIDVQVASAFGTEQLPTGCVC